MIVNHRCAIHFGLKLVSYSESTRVFSWLRMRLPDDKRARLLRKDSLALLRLNDASVAEAFVFTTIGIVISSLD